MDNILDLENFIEKNKLNIIDKIDTGLEMIQNNFLETKIGEVIDNAIELGIKSIFPNFMEDQIIEIKDTLFQNGLEEAKNETISAALDIGKSALGIFTGKFENVSQIQQAVEKGGLIDTISSVLDKAIDFAKDNGFIDKNISKILTTEKNSIIKTLSNNIDDSLTSQVKSIEKLDKYCESWEVAYKEQDLTSMNKIYKNIKKQLENTVPLETTINKAREIENLQNLIVNNGGDFNISDEKLELAKVLY